jgi:hypothetical protein
MLRKITLFSSLLLSASLLAMPMTANADLTIVNNTDSDSTCIVNDGPHFQFDFTDRIIYRLRQQHIKLQSGCLYVLELQRPESGDCDFRYQSRYQPIDFDWGL